MTVRKATKDDYKTVGYADWRKGRFILMEKLLQCSNFFRRQRMLLQLSEEKKDLAKAICVADWSWTWCSDDADFHWIEDTLEEITRTAWLQVIWNPAERPQRPSKGLENINPRLEYVGIEDEALAAAREKTGTSVDCTVFKPFSTELFDKCEWKDFHLWIYGSSENFIKKAFGVYAVQGEEICCEGEAAFAAQGYTEIGIITAKNKRRQGYGFATCVRLLEEIKKRGLIPIWACDVANPYIVILLPCILLIVYPISWGFNRELSDEDVASMVYLRSPVPIKSEDSMKIKLAFAHFITFPFYYLLDSWQKDFKL